MGWVTLTELSSGGKLSRQTWECPLMGDGRALICWSSRELLDRGTYLHRKAVLPSPSFWLFLFEILFSFVLFCSWCWEVLAHANQGLCRWATTPPTYHYKSLTRLVISELKRIPGASPLPPPANHTQKGWPGIWFRTEHSPNPEGQRALTRELVPACQARCSLECERKWRQWMWKKKSL